MIPETTQAAEPSLSELINSSETTETRSPEVLFIELYSELRRIARGQLVRHGSPMSLGATTLLHQTYLSLAERTNTKFPDRFRFLRYAARAMRGLIIDHARRQRVQRRGGGFELAALDTETVLSPSDDRQLVLIGEALDELAQIDPSLAELVDLKFFCGFCFAEIAQMRGVSERTVQRNWEKARIYLHRSIRPDLHL